MIAANYALNGGRPISNLTDYEVEGLFLKCIPPNTYTSINVLTVNYRFAHTALEVKAREVTLTRTALSTGWECIKVFFQAVIGLSVPNDDLLNDKLIIQQLTGNAKDPASHKASMEEVKKAYLTCARIKLIISDDCNRCEAVIGTSTFFIVAKKTGEVSNAVMKTLQSVLLIIGHAQRLGKS